MVTSPDPPHPLRAAYWPECRNIISEGGSVPTEGDVMISCGTKMSSDGGFVPYRGGTTTPEGGIIFSEIDTIHSRDAVLNTGRRDAFSMRHYAIFGMAPRFLDCAIIVIRGFAYVFGPCKSISTSVLWHQMAPLKLMVGARAQCVSLLDEPWLSKTNLETRQLLTISSHSR